MNEDRLFDVAAALDDAATELRQGDPEVAAGSLNEAASRLRDTVEDSKVDEEIGRIKQLREAENDCIRDGYLDISDDCAREINTILHKLDFEDINQAEQLPGVPERLDESDYYD